MKRFLTRQIEKLPCIGKTLVENYQLRRQLDQYKTWVPPGHYYSPIPSIEEVKQREQMIFDFKKAIPAIDLNEEEQIDLLNRFKLYYKDQPFSDYKQDNLRYFFKNSMFPYADAIFLYCMIRDTRPKRIIEVGVGYSSAVILDTNELFFQNRIHCTFIDPFPQTLLSLLKEGDEYRNEIISKKVQDLDVRKFLELSEGDILFVDSTHVSKVGSDVNFIFFHVLPSLNYGVYVHFHDIAYPFEYPKDWIYEGRAWNEAYLLRAFLQYNNAFKIVLFNDLLAHFHRDKLSEMPLCMKHTGGGIWIRKVV